MALTDLTTYAGEPAILELNRGDIGTVTDANVQGQAATEIEGATTTEGDFVFVG